MPNLISLATRLPYLFLSYTVHEEQPSQKRTERKLQNHLFFTFVCRLAAISRDPPRIPLVCSPKQSISTCPPGCCTATKQTPLYPPIGGTLSSWHSWYVTTCLHLRRRRLAPLHVHHCELCQSFASAETPSQRLRGPRASLYVGPRG